MRTTVRLSTLVLIVLGHVASLSAAPYSQHFTSHVSVATPDVSYSHGVGNPTTLYATDRKHSQPTVFRGTPYATKSKFRGYPKYRPSIPFLHDEAIHDNVLTLSPWSSNNLPDLRYIDPYLLQGSDAVEAFAKIKSHGEWFFEEIPHYRSLLANQQQRKQNGLSTHRYGSIRPASPFFRA